MKMCSAALIGASMFGALAMIPVPAQALPAAPGVRAPTAIEQVQCRWRTVRSWHHGRLVNRRVWTCPPGWRRSRAQRCHVERHRVVLPNGRVTWRSREVCRPRW